MVTILRIGAQLMRNKNLKRREKGKISKISSKYSDIVNGIQDNVILI